MMQAQEPGKRIVSSGEYAAKMSKKVTIGTFGLFCIGIGVLLFCAMCLSLTCTRNGRLDIRSIPLTISFCVFAGVAGYFGTRLFQTAERIEPGIPVTRANTGDLPAPDSLVRASQEPAQAQEDILLRAAAQTQERHEEQLLRAAAGQQKE